MLFSDAISVYLLKSYQRFACVYKFLFKYIMNLFHEFCHEFCHEFQKNYELLNIQTEMLCVFVNHNCLLTIFNEEVL